MLSYVLAIAVALSSLVLFSTAFLMSDIHRQDDFLWSGIGLFYALVLWFCARNISGAVLLGQAAASTLLVSYNWQTLKLRKAISNPAKASEINNFSVLQAINGLFKRGKSETQAPVPPTSSKVTEEEIAIPDTNYSKTAPTQSEVKKKKLGVFGKLLGKKKAAITNTKLDEILDKEVEVIDKKAQNTSIKTPESSETKTIAEDKTPTANNINTDSETVSNKTVENKENETSRVEEQKLTEIAEVKQVEEKTIIEDQAVDTDSSLETNVTPPVETPPVETPPEVAKETETSVIATDNQAEKPNIADVELNQESENNSTKTTEEVVNIESEKESKVSPLDSLETVEVAEVLEADPEDISANRESDQSNIIEVTTTEINTNPEADKPDHNQENNSNPA